MKLLFERKSKFVGAKCLNYVIKFISASTTVEKAMFELKPYVDTILQELVLPIMLIT